MTERLVNLVWVAVRKLDESTIDGRAKWITGHKARRPDGSIQVAFRAKHSGTTAAFIVDTELEAKQCCDLLRKLRRQ